MVKKNTKYRFNEETLNFEPMGTSSSERIRTVIVHCLIGLVLGMVAFILYANLFESPDARRLQEANDRLAMQYELLLRQTKDIEEVLSDLEERDDNMYRAILQAEPIENRAGNFNENRYANLLGINHSNLVVNTTREIDELSRRTYLQSKSYDELIDLIRDNEDRLRHIPAIQPVMNKNMRRESSGYGRRIDPIYKVPKFHAGLDFSVPLGTDVYVTADGVISYTGYQRGGYGHVIKVDHGYDYQTVYAHLKNTNKVRKGQKVKRGDVIAESGNTGKSTAPHLHYEVRLRGKPDNPVYYFFKDLSPEEYDDMLMFLSNSGPPMD